ncbi:MAG: serine hydrolase domain-containing protein [Bacteroidota bacterium]
MIKHTYYYLIAILFLSLVTSCEQPKKEIKNESLNIRVIDSIRAYAEIGHIPGLSFVQLSNNRVKSSFEIGVIRADSLNQVEENTIFEAASLTKPIIAYCALKLVEQKIIDLETPLYSYYPYHDIAHNERYRSVTTRMILSHTSGLPNWRLDEKSDCVNLKFIPGSRFGYSGEGFVYLQKVMEHVLKKDLNTIAHEFVFDPLHMTNSSLIFRGDETGVALGHDFEGRTKAKNKPLEANAAFSLHTTAQDYAKFLMELGQPEFINGRFIQEMLSPQKNAETSDSSISWGLGVGLNTTKNDSFIWHWGDNGRFKSFFIVSAKTGNGFTYFSNSDNGLSIIKRLIKLVFSDEEIMKSWNDYRQI